MQLSLLGDFELEQPEVDSDNWFTPTWIIQAAREVMGGIDLDPASCPKANAIVKAAAFHTKRDDGLSKIWRGRIWLNPPYSMPLISDFSHALLDFVDIEVSQACVLTRNATETKWCQKLLMRCDGRFANRRRHRFCLLNKRVSFWHPDKVVGTDKCGHILFYFGSNTAAFEQLLKPHGLVFHGKKS